MRGDENQLVYADAPVTVPFDGQGLPNQRMTWVQNGELQNLDYCRVLGGPPGHTAHRLPVGLVHGGEISHPVKNFRWNESPIFMLNNIEMMGEPVRISSGESSGLTNAVVVPPLKVRDFTFTSLSDAI